MIRLRALRGGVRVVIAIAHQRHGEPSSPDGMLVVVPCGRSKIWDREPDRGAVRADAAYTGTPFRLNRAYAERFGTSWVILSAKYGFLWPGTEIPGPYEVTFKRRTTNPITAEALRQQVGEMGLDRFGTVVILGGREYREAVGEAFAGAPSQIVAPFAGLPIGKAMQATKRAIERGQPAFTETPVDG